MRLLRRKTPASTYVSPYQGIYDMIESDDPERRERGLKLIGTVGPVPGSFGDRNSYGPGPCRHLAPYPGCPKCWHRRSVKEPTRSEIALFVAAARELDDERATK